MSTIREYLEAKAAQPENEWLRREPRTTHPEILEAVRAFQAAGGFYDDDAEQYVAKIAGDMPEHRRHAHRERHHLTKQLGHECYLAKGIISDEQARNSEQAAIAEGYEPLTDAVLVDGAAYLVRIGVRYSGSEQATYSEPRKLKARRDGNRWVFMPPRARTRGLLIGAPALVKAA